MARGLRPDRNPLRRRSDRVEAYLLTGSLAAMLAAAPFAAKAASQASYTAAAHTEQAQLATRYEVKAVLLQAAGNATAGYSLESDVPVQAHWTSVGGVPHTGQVMAPPGTAKGKPVLVWTTKSGTPTGPPLQPGQVAGQADLAAVAAVTGIGVLYLCEAAVVRRILSRRRMAAWDADWAVTEPLWNRQRW